jgi:hypothetical protein
MRKILMKSSQLVVSFIVVIGLFNSLSFALAKTVNLSENKDFLISQSGQVYKCINDHDRFSIVPGIPGATFSRISCLIPVKLVKRCMQKIIVGKTFFPCSLALPSFDGVPANPRYYEIIVDRSGYPTFFTID